MDPASRSCIGPGICQGRGPESALIVSTYVLRLKAAESFLETSEWCTYFTEKSGVRDVKRADFIRYWRRSGLTEVYCSHVPDAVNIFA